MTSTALIRLAWVLMQGVCPFGFLVLVLLGARAWVRWWYVARSATAWDTALAEVVRTAPRGERAAVFHDRTGRRAIVALTALLPAGPRAGLKSGDRLDVIYCRRDCHLACGAAARDWLGRRLSAQRWMLSALIAAMAVGLSIIDQIGPA